MLNVTHRVLKILARRKKKGEQGYAHEDRGKGGAKSSAAQQQRGIRREDNFWFPELSGSSRDLAAAGKAP